jgi:hypothetical protein
MFCSGYALVKQAKGLGKMADCGNTGPWRDVVALENCGQGAMIIYMFHMMFKLICAGL